MAEKVKRGEVKTAVVKTAEVQSEISRKTGRKGEAEAAKKGEVQK